MTFYNQRRGADKTRTNTRDAAAEKKMWVEDVAGAAHKEARGLLVVEVGRTHFSTAAGKFLLVTNNGMQAITMTVLQMETLATALTPKVISEITDKINAKDTDANKSIEFVWNANATSAGDFRIRKGHFGDWLKSCTDQAFTVQEGPKVRNYRTITLTLAFNNYRVAKQTARVLYPRFVTFRQQQDVDGKNMSMTAMGHTYDLVNEAVPKAWDYKDQPGKHVPQGTSLLRA
jgi:hypothetical protein